MRMNTPLKDFLEIPYDKLEEMNLKAKEDAAKLSSTQLEKKYVDWLKKEKRIKAVTLLFSDIEGRLHMLDYDKKFLLESLSNLTFDGSSIRGFTPQHESDLRLEVDWSSIRWMPSDVFGPGKVIFFATVLNRDRTPYISDFRGRLKEYTAELKKKAGLTAEAQRAMGFKNEKDHPEVAPSQFEMNFSYAEVVRAADNVQLYKLICRQ